MWSVNGLQLWELTCDGGRAFRRKIERTSIIPAPVNTASPQKCMNRCVSVEAIGGADPWLPSFCSTLRANGGRGAHPALVAFDKREQNLARVSHLTATDS
ncbi:uncharacterized protein ACO6RY_18944 [Pungitius sinensis]